MGRKRRGRFRRAIDAQEQYESIEKKQRKRRSKGIGPLIERIDKSQQRVDNALKRIKKVADRKDEFD